MTDPLFPFEIRLHRDAFSVHKVHHVSLTDPVLADPDKVKAWHVWRQFDSLTAPTKYKDWQRNSDNTDWLFLNAWYLDQEYADGQVPVADADGYFLPGDAGGAESGGPIDGAGTGGMIAKWADSNTLEDSSLDENTSDITSTKPLYLPAGTTSVPSLRLPHGAAPTSPTNGDLWSTTAGFFGRVNGSTIGPFGEGGAGGLIESIPYAHDLVSPVDGDFSWVNQGAASVDTSLGGIRLTLPENTGNNVRGRVVALPSTPFTLTTHIDPYLAGQDHQDLGLLLRDSVGEGLLLFSNAISSSTWMVRVTAWTNPTSFGSTLVAIINTERPRWLRTTDNGTTRTFEYSFDGEFWFVLLSHARTTHITPNQVGFGGNDNNATYKVMAWLLSWEVT